MDQIDDEIDVCLLWQETELLPERRRPENRWLREQHDEFDRTRNAFWDAFEQMLFRYQVRLAVIAAGLETE